MTETKLEALGIMASGTPAVAMIGVVTIGGVEHLFVGSLTNNRLPFVATREILREDEIGYKGDTCGPSDDLGLDHPVNRPDTNDPAIDDIRIITADNGVLVFNFDTGDCYDGDGGPIILLNTGNYQYAVENDTDGRPAMLFLNPVRIGSGQ